MRHPFSLELGFGLLLLPVRHGQLAEVDIDRLSDERTGADRAVAGGHVLVLPMIFI